MYLHINNKLYSTRQRQSNICKEFSTLKTLIVNNNHKKISLLMFNTNVHEGHGQLNMTGFHWNPLLRPNGVYADGQ